MYVCTAKLDTGKGKSETYMTAPITIGKERNLRRPNIILRRPQQTATTVPRQGLWLIQPGEQRRRC